MKTSAREIRHKFKEFFHGEVLLGRWLTANFKLILLIVGLCIVHITNRYKIEGTVKEIERCSTEIEQLHQKHTQMKALYQNSSMMLVLAKKLEPIGVDVSKEPIKEVIFISK